MITQIDAEELALPRQPGAVIAGRAPGDQPHLPLVSHAPITEKGHLTGGALALDRLGAINDTVEAVQQLLPLPQRVQCAALYQRLQHALVDLVEVEPQT